MFRICKNAPLQWVPAGTYAPVPGPRLLRVGPCLRRWVGATREKKASEGSFSIIGTLYSSGRYRLTLPAEQVSSVSVESVHLRSRGHSPSDTGTAASAAQAQEASSSGAGGRGPHGGAVLPGPPAPSPACMHARWSGTGPHRLPASTTRTRRLTRTPRRTGAAGGCIQTLQTPTGRSS